MPSFPMPTCPLSAPQIVSEAGYNTGNKTPTLYLIQNRTPLWPWSKDNHEALPTSDDWWHLYMPSGLQQLCSLYHIVYSGAVFLHLGPPWLSKPDHTMLFKPQEVFLCYFFADRSLIFQYHCLVKTFLFQKLFHVCKVWMSLLQKKKYSVPKLMADRMPQVENSMLDLRQQVAAKRQTAQIIKNIVWNCLRARCLRCRWNINELSV